MFNKNKESMNYLVQSSLVDRAGHMLQEILYAATDIRENQHKQENLRPFGTCGEIYPVLHKEPQQMQNFITLLCETANKGQSGQLHYNVRTCKNIVLCTHNDYRATLTERNERQQELFAPRYVYEPTERHQEFTDLCTYIAEAVCKEDAKVIIIDNCAHYLQSVDYWEIKTALEHIAHAFGCCIFAGFCLQDTESTYFAAHRQNVVQLASDTIHGQNVTMYIFNNGANMGIYATDTDGKVIATKWHDKYLLRELLPKIASDPVSPKELEAFFFGVYTGDKQRKTIYNMLQGARERGEIVRANTRNNKYIVNTDPHPTGTDGEQQPQQQPTASNIALTALSDMQKIGIRKRIPILKFGEYRQLYCCGQDYPPTATEIIMCAIVKGEYLNIKANTKRKKILFCTHDDWDCKNIEKYIQNYIGKKPDLAKCHITDIKHNLATIEARIKRHTPDYVIIDTGNFEGDNEKNGIPEFELQRMAQTYNVAIIVQYNYLGARKDLQELDKYNRSGDCWTQIAPTGNVSVIRGKYNGIPFKHLAMYSDPESCKLWLPKKDEATRAFLEDTFYNCKERTIANRIPTIARGINDIITGQPVTIKTIKKAAEMGIIRLYKQPITANKHKYMQYIVQYIPESERAK